MVGGIVCIVIGLGIMAAMVAGIIKKRKAANWPRTPATILKSEVILKEFGGGGQSRHKYSPVVEYSYEVDGEVYESRNISGFNESDGYSDETTAQRIADRYPEGETRKVWYNPNAPEEALLDARVSAADFLWFLMPIGFIAIGFAMIFIPE